jgi:Bacterial Ig-like domain (group 2)
MKSASSISRVGFPPRVVLCVSLSAATTVAGCTKDMTSTRPVATVVVNAASPSVPVNATDQFTATTEDASGNVLSGRTITWSSGTPAVATVSSGGLMTAVAPGTATIRATSEGIMGSDSVTIVVPSTTIVVNNQLIDDVIVSANGVALGSVPARTTAQSVVTVSMLTLSYDLVRPQTTAGTPIGEEMSGIFQPVQHPSGTLTFVVNNVLGSDVYFAPQITNNGSNPILMAVNWGTVAENRCNCLVPAFATNVQIGYYHLYSNTEVVAFGDQSGYGSGYYSYWLYSDFQNGIASGSGAVTLVNNTTLTVASIPTGGAQGQLAGFLRGEPSLPVGIASGPLYDHAMPNPHPVVSERVSQRWTSSANRGGYQLVRH